jgi:hypothetical protein
MVDHPLYAMWKQRYAAEVQEKTQREELKSLRREEQRTRREAWDAYEQHWREDQRRRPVEHWWKAVLDQCVALLVWLTAPAAELIAGLPRRRSRSNVPGGTG